jgi:hypothetical protein
MAALVVLAGGSFTFDRLPADAISMMGSRNVPVGVVKKQIYLHSYYLDRPVRQLYETSHVNDILSRGGRVIVGARNLADLSREGDIRGFYTRHTWREWKETITPGEAIHAVVTGNVRPLQESVYLIEPSGLGR